MVLISSVISAQQGLPFKLWQDPATRDFRSIQREVETYFTGKNKGRGSGYKQWKRWEFINKNRLTPDGKIINIAAKNFQEFQEYLAELEKNGTTDGSRSVTNGEWESLGIDFFVNGAGWNPGIGRVNVIEFHPTNPNIYWVGCPSGGLWKTTNDGNTWIPLTDGMPRIGVSGIAVDYTNTNVIYILTGDGDGSSTHSVGILKTTNGGDTWLNTELTWDPDDFVRSYKLIMHPTDHQTLFAVTSEGIYKTVNGGNIWTQKSAGWFFDIEFKPNDPSIIYACKASQFYKSINTGDTWNPIIPGVPTGCERMAIAVSPSNFNYVYILAGPAIDSGSFKGIYRSNNSGDSFDPKADTPNILGYSITGDDDKHQTSYDLALVVSRTNVGHLISGGINTWKSTDYGSNWYCISDWDGYTDTIGYTHADIHNLTINPLNNKLYCCSDGGLFSSTDFGETWTDHSDGLEITQWYRIAGFENNPYLIIGGTQDNGCNKWIGGSTMLHILGADGMDCIIDHTYSNIMYYSSQNGELRKSIDGGSSYTEIWPDSAKGSWVTPFIMHPNNSSIIYGGYDSVHKSTDGGNSWTSKVVDGRGAMAIGINYPGRVYASFQDDIWMSNDGANTWTPISAGLPGMGIAITFITVNPDQSSEVFVTLAGYDIGQKVYKSINAGSTWTNISGTLPNVPMNCIVYEDCNGSPDDALYVGTDIGVFYRNGTMSDWIPFRNGLPTVPVFDMEINYTIGMIRAGTYGRGIWESDLYADCPANYTLTPANDPGNPNYTGFQFYEAGSWITSTRVITGGEGTDVTYKAGGSIKLLQGFHVKKGNRFEALRGPCEATAAPVTIKPAKGVYAGSL